MHWNSQRHLIPVAHGSGIPSYDDDFRRSLINALADLVPTDHIHPCFLRGTPSCTEALSGIPATDQIDVLPLVLADGLLADSLIPNTVRTAWDQLCHQRGIPPTPINFLPHPGYSPHLFRLVTQYLTSDFLPVPPDQVAVLVISHGNSRRHSSLADDLCTRFCTDYPQVGAWHAAYLNQSPEIADVFSDIEQQVVIVIPWFLCPGNHVSLCIPPRLGIPPQTDTTRLFTWHQVATRQVYYAPPVCLHEEWNHAIRSSLS